MKKGTKKALKVIVIFVCVIGVLLLTAPLIKGKSSKVESATIQGELSERICIVMDSSDFKEQVANRIIAEVRGDYAVEIYGLDTLKKIDNKDYEIVVIMAPVYIGDLQTDAKSWIGNCETTDNIFLVYTSATTTNIDLGVDTVSSATIKNNQADMEIETIVASILAKLQAT